MSDGDPPAVSICAATPAKLSVNDEKLETEFAGSVKVAALIVSLFDEIASLSPYTKVASVDEESCVERK